MRRLEIAESELPVIEEVLSKETNGRVVRWLLGIRLVCLKRSTEETGKAVGGSAAEVRRWVNRFNSGGIEAMQPNWSPGRPSKLTAEQMQEFRERICHGPSDSDEFSSWRGHFVRDVLHDEFGVSYKLTGVYKLLHRLDFLPSCPGPNIPAPRMRSRMS